MLKDFAHKHNIGQRVIWELDSFLHRIRDDFRPIDKNVGFESVDEEDILSCELSVIDVAWNQNPSNKKREHTFIFLHPTSTEDAVITFGSGIPQTALVDV